MRKTAILLVSVFLLAVVATATEPMPTWKSQTMNINNQAKVGDVVLPAGEYRVTHEMEGTKHILVLKLQAKGTPVYRLACTMEPLEQKAKASEQHYRYEGKDRVLTAIIFKGDTVRHLF
jgi:hypothetical protein